MSISEKAAINQKYKEDMRFIEADTKACLHHYINAF